MRQTFIKSNNLAHAITILRLAKEEHAEREREREVASKVKSRKSERARERERERERKEGRKKIKAIRNILFCI